MKDQTINKVANQVQNTSNNHHTVKISSKYIKNEKQKDKTTTEVVQVETEIAKIRAWRLAEPQGHQSYERDHQKRLVGQD